MALDAQRLVRWLEWQRQLSDDRSKAENLNMEQRIVGKAMRLAYENTLRWINAEEQV